MRFLPAMTPLAIRSPDARRRAPDMGWGGLSFVVACTLVHGIFCPPAYAQTPSASVRAEEAYGRIDFEATLSASTEAIDAGGLDAAACARLYFLIGVARAALGNEAESRDAFLRMLMLDPERTVDRSLSPRLRAPYLEAKGLFGARAERLTLAVDFVASTNALVIRARDPVSFVTRVRFAIRRGAAGAFSQQERAFAPELSVPVPDGTGPIQVAVALLDEHGNLLRTAGTEAEPRVFGADAPPARTPAVVVRERGTGHIVTAAVASGIGALGVGAGIAGILLRADSAETFNDDAQCFQPRTPRLTRGEQCASELDAVRNGEILAGLGFAVAGAAAFTAVLALIWGGGDDEGDATSAGVSCGSGPGTFGLACGGRF
jgi:hypothetical protein